MQVFIRREVSSSSSEAYIFHCEVELFFFCKILFS
jgi:hypothetical protein